MNWQQILMAAIPSICVSAIGALLWRHALKQTKALENHFRDVDRQFIITQERLQNLASQRDLIEKLLKEQTNAQYDQQQRFMEHQVSSLKTIQESLNNGMREVRNQITNTLNQHSQEIGKRVDKLTHETQLRLKEISGEVDRRLAEGFEKTTTTFTDVIKRLAIIDEAQKKITELSGNVVSLQEILQDKKSRGAFGEVQLTSLVRNLLPESNFALQHTLSNGKRVDCMLFLPEPTGNISLDAKFPLESFRQLGNAKSSDMERRQAEQTFRQDIRKHIQDIASKYIIPNETADGAVMFIPAEAIFAEIHANYADIVDYANQSRVWLVSPTTMMAILTTARAVLKDAATRKQVHIIQKHLVALGQDFERFQKRMDNLAKHIDMAQQDVEQVHKSSKKISSRFMKIEKVELQTDDKEAASILLSSETE